MTWFQFKFPIALHLNFCLSEMINFLLNIYIDRVNGLVDFLLELLEKGNANNITITSMYIKNKQKSLNLGNSRSLMCFYVEFEFRNTYR